MTEAQIEHAIRKRLGREADLILFRNTVGVARHGDRFRHYGLCPGSSDLVGILRSAGRWVALEVKTPRGRCTDLQQLFLDLIRRFGGFAAVVRSVPEALAALDRARAGENS